MCHHNYFQSVRLGLVTLILLTAVKSFSAVTTNAIFTVAGDCAFETSALMRELLPEDRHTPPANWASHSGAAGINTKWETNNALPWFIESQKEGWDWIASGMAMTNLDSVRWGLKILDWGWARMESDGSFKHPDNYHSASFFIEATAHSILLLENSSWRAEFAPQLDAFKPKLLAAARWMIRPDIDAANWPDDAHYPQIFGDRRYAHRRFLDAAALGEVAVIFHDHPLLEKSVWLIRNGIAFQQPDGVNPERGGHDSSYQALGLLYACRYYQIIADDKMRAEMKPMLDKGFNWLRSRIKPDGQIDGTGNTRTGPAGELGRNGKPKQLDYHGIAVVLAHWAQLTSDADWQTLAQKTSSFERKAKVSGNSPAK
jgi:hypothetical protein